jgi:hypothetical protein
MLFNLLPDMADRSGGNNYEDLKTGGNARVHAGSVYNTPQITNNVYNYIYVDHHHNTSLYPVMANNRSYRQTIELYLDLQM